MNSKIQIFPPFFKYKDPVKSTLLPQRPKHLCLYPLVNGIGILSILFATCLLGAWGGVVVKALRY
jgi:hypothetical protein